MLFIYRVRILFFQVIGNLLYIITTATHHKDEITRFYHIIHLIVIESQCIVSYLKSYSFAFTHIQMNFLKPFNSFIGRVTEATLSCTYN